MRIRPLAPRIVRESVTEQQHPESQRLGIIQDCATDQPTTEERIASLRTAACFHAGRVTRSYVTGKNLRSGQLLRKLNGRTGDSDPPL